jgi:hypothetical protein
MERQNNFFVFQIIIIYYIIKPLYYFDLVECLTIIIYQFFRLEFALGYFVDHFIYSKIDPSSEMTVLLLINTHSVNYLYLSACFFLESFCF